MQHLGAEVPLHFTAFHPDWEMTDVPPTPPATLTRAREIALRHGLRYVYTGNVHDETGGSTYCPACGNAVIVRDWYDIRGYHLRSEEHTSELQSPCNLVCRLLLEKKKNKTCYRPMRRMNGLWHAFSPIEESL